MSKYEILMAGTGGQGLVFVASFLAEAAVSAGMNVVQTQSYGISQRGGFISAEVIIDENEILFQQVVKPSIIIALSDVVGTRYDNSAATVIYDNSLMKERGFPNWLGVPCSKIAKEAGVPKSVNLVALGAALRFCPAVSFETITAAALKSGNEKIAKLNAEALKRGYEAVATVKAV